MTILFILLSISETCIQVWKYRSFVSQLYPIKRQKNFILTSAHVWEKRFLCLWCLSTGQHHLLVGDGSGHINYRTSGYSFQGANSHSRILNYDNAGDDMSSSWICLKLEQIILVEVKIRKSCTVENFFLTGTHRMTREKAKTHRLSKRLYSGDAS